MMKNSSSSEFFYGLPDNILVEIAENDWEGLELLCKALSIDLQLEKENPNEGTHHRRNLC